jgi:xylose dehydrogenase (NAD/NADP)
MSGEPVRWGIVSTADINRALLPGFRASAAASLVAVASRSQEAADAYARAEGIPKAHGSYEALLADPDVEAVYIPLPNSLHVDWSIRALQAGKHVLCEKPLDRRPGEVARAFDAADSAGRILMEAFMYRHHPQTKRAAKLVADGAVGDVRVIRSSFGFTLHDDANVRFQADLDGGALMDVGCYCISASRLFAGEPSVAIGRAVRGASGVDVRFAGTLVFPGDVLAHFDCGFDVPDNSHLEVVGSEGTLRIPSPFMLAETGIELRRGSAVERVPVANADRYQEQLENMCAAVRGEAEPLLGRADALGQSRTIEALYRSADAGGEPVTI